MGPLNALNPISNNSLLSNSMANVNNVLNGHLVEWGKLGSNRVRTMQVAEWGKLDSLSMADTVEVGVEAEDGSLDQKAVGEVR